MACPRSRPSCKWDRSDDRDKAIRHEQVNGILGTDQKPFVLGDSHLNILILQISTCGFCPSGTSATTAKVPAQTGKVFHISTNPPDRARGTLYHWRTTHMP
jgi:hypothetical protein